MGQLGTVQTVVVCVSGSSGVQGACPVGSVQSVTQAYLVAPGEAARFDLIAQSVDPLVAGQYFGFAFASTIFVWLFSHGLGQLVRMVRNG